MSRNLYKRGRFYYYDFTINGKRYNASTGREYRSQAERIFLRKRLEVLENKAGIRNHNRVRFDELTKEFLDWSITHLKGMHKRDVVSVKHLDSFFGNKRIHDINPELIEKYMSDRRKFVSGSTVNREIQTLRRMFTLAIKWDFIESNPAKAGKIVFYPEPPKTYRWIRPDEINRLLQACYGKIKHVVAVILIAVHTCMRKRELFNLKWEYVDLTNRQIIIKHTKHHQNPYIPLNEDVVNVFLDMILRRSENIFTNDNGQGFTRVDKALATAVKRSGIQRCTLHDFRATWATELLASGEDIETVRQLGGWRDYTTILRYLEAIPE